MLTIAEIDDILIANADVLSPSAISFKLEGLLTPAQVRARITTLLDAPDWLTSAQADQLVTMKMRQIVTALTSQTLTARNAEVILNGLEKIGNRLDRRHETTEKDLQTLYAFQGTVLLDAISVALQYIRSQVAKGDPGLELQFDRSLETALRFAQIELNKHEEGAEGMKALSELEEEGAA